MIFDAVRTRDMVFRSTIALLAVVPPATAAAQRSEAPPLSVHGFLSQGYGRAWDYPIAGIPTDGTLDYRALALQVAYRLTDDDKLVIQFNHRRLGQNPLETGDDVVHLDWGFYERAIAGGSARIGKVPLPRGLFNEVRDVGTALPFYRAPLLTYSEAGETLDGAVIGHRFFADRSWSVQAEVFAGAFDFDYVLWPPDASPVVETVEARMLHGTQLWLETPVPGLRFGFAGVRYRQRGEDDDGNFYSSWQASAESIIDRITARTEYQRSTSAGYGYQAGYAQLGVRLFGGVTANVQTEFADVTAYSPVGDLEVDYGRDHVIGVTWMVRPTAALKFEAHRFRGYVADQNVPFYGPPVDGRYAIASIAVGF